MSDASGKKDSWILGLFVDSRVDLISVFLASCISHFLQIFISLFAMVIYNKIVPNNAVETLVTVTVGVCIVIFSDFIFRIMKGRIQDGQNRRLELSLSDRLYKKIISWDLQSVPKLPGGSALLLRDIDTVVQLFGGSTVNIIVGLPFVLFYVAIIFLIAQDLAFVTLASAVLSLVINIIYFKFIEQASSQAKDAQVEKSAAFIETLNNIEGVKSLGSYTHFFEKWSRVQEFNAKQSEKLSKCLSDANAATGLVASLSQVLVLAFGAYLIFSGSITPGALIAAVMMHGRVQQPLQAMMQFLMRYSVAKTALKRLDRVLTSQSNEELRRANIRVSRLSSSITFRNVKFNVGEVQRSVLTVPAIAFPEGQKVGILGSVGSGKSTFVKLLAGVLTPTEGSVAFGPYDTSAIDQGVLRNSVAYLGQQASIFSGTIRENITLSKRDATDDEIETALSLSGFDKILRGFPNGLSFVLSEGGRELSGGQKQILALARTLLSEAAVIALDEPTSAMDPRHELLFVKRMEEFMRGRSLFVVTHRRPILALVDRVIVIENGKIVMDGERDEVLSKFS